MELFSKLTEAAKKVEQKGQHVYEGTKQIVEETKETLEEDKRLYDAIQQANKENKAAVEAAQERYEVSEIILREEARRLDSLKEHIRSQLQQIDSSLECIMPTYNISPQADYYTAQVDVKGPVLSGLAGGSAAAGTTVALVAAFCTAGTGTAISHLSGMYAVHAVLAALGGGTLAAGGAGMAGGIFVAGTLFTIPALLVGGRLVHANIRKAYGEALEKTKLVQEIVAKNDSLTQRNRKAADMVRRLYDSGVEIQFFFQTILQKFILEKRQPDKRDEEAQRLGTIANDAKYSLGTKFLELLPFTAENQIDTAVPDKLQEIHSDYTAIQNALVSENDQIYTSRNINEEIPALYKDAENFIYMTYPWYNDFAVKKDYPYIKDALERGVVVLLCYGIGQDETDRQMKKTTAVINRLEKNFKKYGTFYAVRCNSHRKIMVCEKYSLEGSQNLMSYRYSEKNKDVRDEITTKFFSMKMVREHKQIILNQIGE